MVVVVVAVVVFVVVVAAPVLENAAAAAAVVANCTLKDSVAAAAADIDDVRKVIAFLHFVIDQTAAGVDGTDDDTVLARDRNQSIVNS